MFPSAGKVVVAIFWYSKSKIINGEYYTALLQTVEAAITVKKQNTPDLIRRDFHLFPQLKLFPAQRKFKTDEKITVEAEQYFVKFDATGVTPGIVLVCILFIDF